MTETDQELYEKLYETRELIDEFLEHLNTGRVSTHGQSLSHVQINDILIVFDEEEDDDEEE
jgi:hypothetical protein